MKINCLKQWNVSVMQITEKRVWLRSVVCNCNCNVCVMWVKLLLIMPFLTPCHICCPWWLICPCAGVLLLISSCLAFHVHMWNVEEVSEHSHATKYKLQQMEMLILFWLTALADIYGREEVSQIFLNYSFSFFAYFHWLRPQHMWKSSADCAAIFMC